MDLGPQINQGLKHLSEFELTMSIMITFVVATITILVVLFFGIWKFRTKVLPSQSEANKKYRFRKRDKMLFYGRKMLRKVRSFTKNTIAVSRHGRKKMSQKDMVNRLRRFLERRKDSSLPQLRLKEPPKSFFEADTPDVQETDHRLPSEVLYMLRSIRVFGHLEKPFFLELCRHMEPLNIKTGNYLFKIGDQDDSIYVVQSGQIEVFVTEKDGSQHLVKMVTTGDSIHSLLSMLDFLTGHPAPYKTVSAKAAVDSLILKLPASAFSSMFKKFPESIVRVVQIMMIRLQRVTFMALHNYLGLSSELINPESRIDLRTLSIQTIAHHGSPHKVHKYAHSSSMGTSGVEPEEKTEDADSKRPGYIRSTSEQVTGRTKLLSSTSDKDRHPSDFDTACMRARVPKQDCYSSAITGSPPSRQLFKESDVDGPATPSFRHRPKRSSGHGDTLGLMSDSYSDEYILELAQKDLLNLLGLTDRSLLEGHLNLQSVKAGTVLCRQGDQDASLVFVVMGTLHMLQQIVGEEAREAILFTADPGEIVGTLAVLTGEPSLFSIKAKTDSRVVSISKEDFYIIMRAEPFVVLNAAHTTVKRMTPFVRQIDFALDWQMTEAGKALFRQGDNSESVFIVLTGRLRSVITLLGGKKELVEEYGRGELVGIVEVLTQTERATTVMAVRDTEVAKMPSELLNLIKRKYPQIVTRLIHLLGQRILGNLQSRNTLGAHISMPFRTDNPGLESRSVCNLATVAVLPASDDVPLTNFTLELQHNLSAIGLTTRLSSDIIKTRLGSSALDSVNEFRLFSWLGQQEDIHRMVLYQCDYTMTRWTKNCIRQADCILIVAQADHDHTVGTVEKELEGIAIRAQKELVLLHREDAETPRRTADWLNARDWCSHHHHIRCPPRVFSKKPLQKRLDMYSKLFEKPPHRQKDFSRLARYLTGTSIGLVLGGGGARGLSHVGMIKAITEAGIPIDMVGGTSMGSFIGALWCEEQNYTRFTQRGREWSMDMTSLWKKIIDLTYPVTSMFTGGAFNRCIEQVFKDRQVEDLWLPFFCVTTDISNSSMRIHTTGSLWRYVRASMSLSGYLPPMCDPMDGHHLLDGGYVNNVPADVMRAFGAQTILALDVGSEEESNFLNYGDQVSGWWLLWKRWNPWTENVKVLDMTEIQSRLAYVSCVRQLDLVKSSDYCEYMRPPIDKYGTLQFGSYDEISDVGYHYGKTLFNGWMKGGYLDKLFIEKTKETEAGMKKKQQQVSHVPVMAYFTDLAEKVSKITKPKSTVFYLTDDDYETEYTDEEMIIEEDGFLDDDGSEHDAEKEEDDEEEDHPTVERNPVYSSSNSENSAAEALTTRKRKPVSGKKQNT
ncbi:patatin-like phospholipase domain-containing protein 7 isoform X1 [Haliotis rufescens]|uniref:patatin-like phospholipase domain-containing protein 7 isoform X1 n=3 Tax=Haliotis rufescens TaxID=6454 RepID=UPI00201EA8EA|nr:patatin-like phospholipase domain-containing protein 7 isoform X1 [Haliotis rufescens]